MSRRSNAAHKLQALGHLLAGKLQSAINTAFVLQRRKSVSTAELDSLVADLHLVRERLEEVLTLAVAQTGVVRTDEEAT
jgi:hypothetical protein